MAGSAPSSVDCFLLPALYHISIAGAAYKGFEIPVQFDALITYMERNLAAKSVKSTTPPAAMVRWGWANARGDEAAAFAAAAELPSGSRRRKGASKRESGLSRNTNSGARQRPGLA